MSRSHLPRRSFLGTAAAAASFAAADMTFVNRLRSRDPNAGQRIGVSSHWFRVTGEVTVGASLAGLRALVHRSDQGLTSIRWASDHSS